MIVSHLTNHFGNEIVNNFQYAPPPQQGVGLTHFLATIRSRNN